MVAKQSLAISSSSNIINPIAVKKGKEVMEMHGVWFGIFWSHINSIVNVSVTLEKTGIVRDSLS